MDLRDVMAGTTRAEVPNQNLINPTPLTEVAQPAGFWKSVALDLLSLLAALFLGYTYFRYLTTGLSPWYATGFFLAFSALSVLQMFLAKNVLRRTLVLFAEAVALVACFFFYDDAAVVLIAGGLVFVALLWGYFASRVRVYNEVEIEFFGSTRAVLGKLVTGVLLFMIVVYVPQAQGDNIFMSRDSFQTLFNWAAGFVDNFYPNIPLTGTFGDFSKSVAQAQMQNNATFTALTPTQQNAALEQAVAELSGTAAQATGVTPAPSDPVSNIAYDAVVSALVSLKEKFPNQFTLIWIVILFIILRTAGVIAVWVAQLASLVVYEILLALGFMHIEEATQTKEELVY